MSFLHALRRLVFLFVFGATGLAAQAGSQPYDAAAFEAAVAAGKPAVVQFHADWCPTCKAQAPLVADLSADARFRSLNIFIADYDREKALRQKLKVAQQSTFVVFKGGAEVARSTGMTRKDGLAELFAKAL